MDSGRIDLLIKYALAVAGQADFGERELGEIHFLKYVYVGDLAHAQAHDGETYTGAPWQFYKFGPWCSAVRDRIAPVISLLGVTERRFTSPKFEGEGVRWELRQGADEIAAEIERQLPWEVARAVKFAVRKFGDDTTDLLHYVYGTPPMLSAAPGEQLTFRAAEPHEEYHTDPKRQLTEKQRKKRRQAREKLREDLRARLASGRPKLLPPDPPPRYDDVFEQGVHALDVDAGPELEAEEGELTFSPAIWKCRGRYDPGVP